MARLLVKGRREGREIVRVTPESAGWKYVGFAAYRLARGETLVCDADAREQCLVVLSGVVSVRSGERLWREIGERASVFEGRSPYAVYLPSGCDATIAANTAAEIGIASAPATPGDLPPRLIEPASMRRSQRGQGLNERFICDILPQTEPAQALLVVEVLTPAGHSSSYPPHKHDRDNLPEESLLEETYFHRLNPAQGFAFQRVYTDDRALDESMAVETNDVVLVPRGYHPVVVPYGYDSYYLNVMAGPTRHWSFKNDPVHEWMLKPSPQPAQR
jgi:5-deoxy-glucuronate isomerase